MCLSVCLDRSDEYFESVVDQQAAHPGPVMVSFGWMNSQRTPRLNENEVSDERTDTSRRHRSAEWKCEIESKAFSIRSRRTELILSA